jgi:hypothetical protein
MSTDDGRGRVSPDERFLSDLSKVWQDTSDTIESFGNTYLSAAAEREKISGPEWVGKNVELVARMWLLGLRSMALVIQRTVDEATERVRNPPSDESDDDGES